jgi:hypothetical protein
MRKQNSKNCNMVLFYQLTITNSSKFASNITALNNGKTVNKPKDYRFQIGDYRRYKEKDFYYNKLCPSKKFILE